MTEYIYPTPAPWKIQRYTNYFGFSIHAEGRGCIAERWYDSKQESPYAEEITANAKIIAAAPVMLEALRVAAKYCYDKTGGCPGIIEAAITEATTTTEPTDE